MPRTALGKITGLMFLGALAMAMLASLALAQSSGPELAELRAAAEELERAGDYEGCGQAYMDIYKRAPQAEGMDAVIYNAGVCFEAAGTVGFAIRMYTTLERQFPRSRLVERALLRMSAAFASTANYEQAARGYEQYARRYAGEKDAPAALSEALVYRQALGQNKEAIANAELFIRQYGRKLGREAAEARLRVAELHERAGDRDQAVASYRRYLREVGKAGGADRLLIGHARLGELLWKQSCPSEGPGGACIRLERNRAPTRNNKVAPRCGTPPSTRLVVESRTRDLAAEAEKHFQSALRLAHAGAIDNATDPQRMAEVEYWLGAARFYVLDDSFEQFLGVRYPANADRDGDAGAKKRFQEWMSSTERQLTALLDSYDKVGTSENETAPWALAASARMGLVAEHFSQLLGSAALPARLRRSSGPNVEAYCKALRSEARPIADRGMRAAGYPVAAEVHGASDAIADILTSAPLERGPY